MRKKIIQAMKSAFESDERIHAMWLEGAYGLGRADEYPTSTLWFDVADGSEESLLDECQRLLETFGALDIVDLIRHPHPQIFQRNMHIAGTSEFLMVDICVQSHSRDRSATVFLRGNIAELPLVLFDKSGVISLPRRAGTSQCRANRK